MIFSHHKFGAIFALDTSSRSLCVSAIDVKMRTDFRMLSRERLQLGRLFSHLYCTYIQWLSCNYKLNRFRFFLLTLRGCLSIADGNKFGGIFHLILNDKNMLIISIEKKRTQRNEY